MSADSDSKIVQTIRSAMQGDIEALRQGSVMPSDETVTAVKAELFRRLDAAPWGTRSRLQKQMKVGKNFFTSLRKASRICLRPLTQVLELLKVSPAEFFLTALTPKRIHELLASSLPPSGGEPPATVLDALQRLEKHPPSTTPRILGTCHELTRLEELRWDYPQKAKQQLERALVQWPIDTLPEVLLIYGTTLRQLNLISEAKWAYFAVELCARKMNNRSILASVLKRRSWVEFAEGNVDASLDLLRRSVGIFEELGDRSRSARSLVSIAIQYVETGRLYEARICAERSLKKLNDDERKHRFSSHQVLAYCTKETNDTEAAVRHLEAARVLLSHCPKAAKIRFIWLEARMKREIFPLEKSAYFFKSAATYFDEIGETQAGALALLEFTRCLVDLNKTMELQQVAESLRSAAFEVDDGSKSGSVSATALMEVYRLISAASTEFSDAEILSAIQDAAGALAAPAAIEV